MQGKSDEGADCTKMEWLGADGLWRLNSGIRVVAGQVRHGIDSEQGRTFVVGGGLRRKHGPARLTF